jgi:DNA-binding SARP family transcriptional activator/tetratricopeptide (TPR) repeat protein
MQMQAGPALRLCLLGEPVVRVDEAQPRPLERHDAALLALLLLEGPQPRAGLAHLLWPDAEPAKALNSLRQRLHRLRREAGELIDGDHGAVRMAPSVAHDLHPSLALSAPGPELELLGALHFPPDEPLADRVQALRERWQSLRVDALEAAAEQAEQDKHFDAAVRSAERLLLLRPLSEHAHRRCMRLHYLRGDRAQALVAYARCRDRLRLQLGVAPDTETEQLARLLESGALSGRDTGPDTSWATPRVALMKPPRLVGRQGAWSLLESVCHEPVVVLIRGEAGIGKSRLASEFAQARGPALVVKAHGGDQASPFALANRLLHQMRAQDVPLPAWALAPQGGVDDASPPPSLMAQPGPPQRTRLALTRALDRWVKRRNATLVVDDVQWADQASLELLLGWVDSAASRVPSVLLCVRNDELPAELARWLSARDPGGVLDLRLGALDEAGIADLLDSLQLPSLPAQALATAAASLMRQTGGHPFVLLELLRSKPDAWSSPPEGRWEHPAPQRLMQLLQQRLARLPSDAQRLAAVSALAGACFSRQLAADVTALPPGPLAQAWQQLVDAQLVLNEGGMLDLVAEAVLQGLPATVAAAWHRRIAPALAAQGERADAIALHWQAARCWSEAGRWFEQAASCAALAARRVEELAFRDQAAACFLQGQDEPAHLSAQLAAVSVALVVEGAQVLARRIATVEAQVSQPAQRLELLLAKSRALINSAEAAAALASSEQALQLADALDDAAGQVCAVAWKALAMALSSQLPDSLRMLSAYADRARVLESRQARMAFFGSWGYVQFLAGLYAEALEALSTAASLAEELGDLGEAMEQVCNISTCLNSLGRPQDSLVQGERALDLWRRHGEPKSVSAAVIQTQLAAIYTGRGRFQDAIELLGSALKSFRDMGPPNLQTTAEHRLATAYLRLGQPGRARQSLTPLPDAADAGRKAMRTMIECRIAAALGQPVLHRLQQAQVELAAQLTPVDRHGLLLLLAAHLPAEASGTLALQVLHEAEAAGDAPAALHARVRLAEALRQRGEVEQAAQHARKAWSSGPDAAVLDLDRPSTNWLIHRAALAGGDSLTATEALLSAAQWISTALPHVHEAYRSSFCERNAVNRDILAAAHAPSWSLLVPPSN